MNSLVNIAHFETTLDELEPHELDKQNSINNLVECHFICALKYNIETLSLNISINTASFEVR